MRTIAVGLLAFMLSPLALGASHDLKTFISEHDLNHDGSVSKEEFAQERERLFAAMDTDHDGGLSHDEYVGDYRKRLMSTNPEAATVQRQMRQAEVRFKVLDSNKDGKISPAEYAYSGWRMFTHHDAKNDGAVSIEDEGAKKAQEDKEDKGDAAK